MQQPHTLAHRRRQASGPCIEILDRNDGPGAAPFACLIRGEPQHSARQPQRAAIGQPDRRVDEADRPEVHQGWVASSHCWRSASTGVSPFGPSLCQKVQPLHDGAFCNVEPSL